MKEQTQSVRINKDVVRQIKIFIANNGGSIKKVLESGSLWIMTDGAKKYIKELKS